MNTIYILVVITCKEGVTTTETTLFNDLVSAKIRFGEELKYQNQTAPEKTEIYDGYYGNNHFWFEVGETSENYWCRAEIQTKEF